MLNIALFGPPGAGKGTQSKLLLDKYNLAYISTGDILREELANDTDLGRQAKDIIKKGGLVPDEIIVQLIERNLKEKSEQVNGFLFDGFPRTTVQAYILEGLLLELNTSLHCMMNLDVPKDQLLERMKNRAAKENRPDDTPEVMKYRLQEYDDKTRPVAQFYQEKGSYHLVDGTGEIGCIHKRLTTIIDKTLQNIWFNVVLLGPPGSGKGTQGKTLAEKFGLTYISTGSLMRKEIKEKTEMGKSAETYVRKGDIVPDEIAIKLIEREIKKNPETRGFIFKGFPRTIVQAYILDGLLRKQKTSLSLVVNLSVPTLESFRRLSARGKTEKSRSYDEDTDTIIKRLEDFEAQSKKVDTYYEKRRQVKKVDGTGIKQEVFDRLSETIEKAMKKAR